jgi:hypothetical protein
VRARLVLKVVTLLVILVCSVVGARACDSSGTGSVVNPSKVVGNGLAGVCANQQAVSDASGGEASPGTLLSPADDSRLNTALGLVGQHAPAQLSCPTPAVNGGG